MHTLWPDLRYAARVLLKNRTLAAMVILTLALGSGVNTAIFNLVNTIILRPLPYPNADRLVRLWDRNEGAGIASFAVSPHNYVAWRERSHAFETLAAYREGGFNLSMGSASEWVEGAQVTASFVPLLKIDPLLGRGFLPEEDRVGNEHVALITHRFWQRRLNGDPGVIGQSLTVNGEPYTVVGVMPAAFKFPQQDKVEVMIPYPLTLDPNLRGAHSLRVLGRLKPGVAVEQAQAEMASISGQLAQEYPATSKGWDVLLLPLHEAVVGDVRLPMLMLFGAVGLVLLIACANVTSLMLVRAVARRKEMAVRAALGAGRWRLFQQLMTESFLFALLGSAAGLLLNELLITFVVKLNPGNLPRLDEVSMDLRVFGFTFAITLVTTVLVGLAPALQAAKPQLQEMLKEGSRTSGSPIYQRLHGLVVILEIALVLVLLVGAGLVTRSFYHLTRVDAGIHPQGVLTMEMSLGGPHYVKAEQRVAFYQDLIEQLKTLPGVKSVAAIHRHPLIAPRRAPTQIEGQPLTDFNRLPLINLRAISPDYFSVLGISPVKGRLFTEREVWQNADLVVINESLARRYWPQAEPIGKRLKVGTFPNWLEVIGVVGDVKDTGLNQSSEPEYYVPYSRTPFPEMTLLVKTVAPDPVMLSAAVRERVHRKDPEQSVYNFKTMADLMVEMRGQPRFNALLLALFALTALLLAVAGIYGVMSYTVAQRTREIGIRLALGAQRSDVMKLIGKQGMTLAVAGVVLGLCASLAVTRLMTSLLFGVSASDPFTFSVISLLLVSIAMLACYLPARRAAKVDPMVALRYE